MKEMKKKEIAVNKSSGAEKVEAVETQLKQERDGENTVYETKTTKRATGSNATQAAKEKAAAKERVKTALEKRKEAVNEKKTREQRKAERKKAAEKRLADRKARIEKKLAARKAAAEKRLAERKARAEKKKAERKARAEKRAAEKEKYIRERAHAKANRTQGKERAKAKRSGNGERKGSRLEGYGGWLAAVITLGTITMALTAVVAIGSLEMKQTNQGMMSGYKGTTYELMSIMENVDNDLDRARVSADPAQQQRILTDLLVQARLAELDLEKLPVSVEENQNVTRFVNKVGMTSEWLLSKLRAGETLTDEDFAVLTKLYETNHEIRAQIGELMKNMDDNMLTEYIKKGEGAIKDALDGLEKLTLDENNIDFKDMKDKMHREPVQDGEKEEQTARIEPAKAEELCKTYFSQYKIDEFQCIGETVAKGYTAYNLQGYDDNGTMLFAEVDTASGELVRFNYYAECQEDKFSTENAKRIAEEFLLKIGYEDMKALRLSQMGTDADFVFVYETEGVAFHPDAVRVKVCKERGIVSSFDAEKYLRNHKERTVPDVKLTIEEAQKKLHKNLTVEASALAIVQAKGGERPAYEFLCSHGEEKYFVYTDANTGREISIVNVKNLG